MGCDPTSPQSMCFTDGCTNVPTHILPDVHIEIPFEDRHGNVTMTLTQSLDVYLCPDCLPIKLLHD